MKNKVIKDDYLEDDRMITEEELSELNSNEKLDNHNGRYNVIKSNKDDSHFNRNFFLYAFLVILFSFLAAFFIKRSYAILGAENLTYQENSNLDYKVYLKKNNFAFKFRATISKNMVTYIEPPKSTLSYCS